MKNSISYTTDTESISFASSQSCEDNWQQSSSPTSPTEPDFLDKQTSKGSADVSASLVLLRHSVQVKDSQPVNPSHTDTNHHLFCPLRSHRMPGSENCLEQKLKTPRRRCQQPKMLNSPEDNMYYNQLNGTLEYQGSKRKPRKLGQIKVLDWEDEYYKSLSAVDSITEEDNTFQALPSSRGVPFQS